jgi:hypothetical protein
MESHKRAHRDLGRWEFWAAQKIWHVKAQKIQTPKNFRLLHFIFMALAIIGPHRITIKKTGQRCQTPNDPIALLQYYMNCLKGCIPSLANRLPSYVTNYANYRNLTRQQKQTVVAYAEEYDIQTMRRAHVFELDANRGVCIDCGNEFVEITDEQVTAIAVRSAAFVQHQVEVKKKMFYTEQWATNNYYDPLRAAPGAIQLADEEEARQRREQAEAERRLAEERAARRREQEQSRRSIEEAERRRRQPPTFSPFSGSQEIEGGCCSVA